MLRIKYICHVRICLHFLYYTNSIRIICILFASFAFCYLGSYKFCPAQMYNDDFSKTQKQKLYKANKIWMVYGWKFLYHEGVQEKKGKKISFERFDREGNRSEEIFYDVKGTPVYSCQFFFDENGNEIKKAGGGGDEVIYEQWIYSANNNGKKVEKKSAFRKLKGEKWIYTLDANQNKTEEIFYDSKGEIFYKLEFLYDSKQNLIEKKEYDSFGNIYQKWIFKYDEKGNNTETHHYVSNNQLYRIVQMRYDKKGNMKSKFILDKDENVMELTVYIFQFYEGLHAPRTVGNKK